MKERRSDLPVIGWREWVGLPELGIRAIKAKVDTGARSSSLHASEVQEFERDGKVWVRFRLHPSQRNTREVVQAEAIVLDSRAVRTSSGKISIRPLIVTNVALLGVLWPVELTLSNRDEMGFRMLLGRQAFRRRFLVDAGKSYCGGSRGRRIQTPGAPVGEETGKGI